MPRFLLVAIATAVVVAAFGVTSQNVASEQPPSIGRTVEDFTLRDFRGAEKSLSDYADKQLVVVAFLGTECPLARLYGPRLVALAEQYQARGVSFLGINSNSQDSITEIAAYARVHEIAFPILKDTGNRVADLFGAERTPEVFVLDDRRRIRYQGRIDDQYGVGYVRQSAEREDLRVAVDELLAGKPVSQAKTTSLGCFIGRIRKPKPDGAVTYGKQIARIFHKHCTECHREGEIAPFALTDYDEVAGWAETIEEVIRDQRMPPWHANPDHGQFANARLMSDEEKDLVYRWVADGAPEGDTNNLPEPRKHVPGWRLPKRPDQVVAISDRPFVVPAEGTVEYKYFVVDPDFEEDKWISAAEVIPGDRSVVHHAIVFIRPPRRDDVKGFGWLTAYVPGQNAMILPAGQARRAPAGSRLVFQMHYTPTGTVKEDTTRVGLVFAEPETVREEVVTLMAINQKFEIPPGDPNYRIDASLRSIPENAQLLAIAPHMHLRGKSFRVVTRSKSHSEILLDVPNYDFNWQHAYVLPKPLPLNEDLQLDCIAHYDNSAGNLVNPDPTAAVRWGDQTWEEMMVGFFEVSVPIGKPTPSQAADHESEAAEKTRELARKLIQKFDRNKDGRVQRDEAPTAFRRFAFREFDTNDDKTITMDEAIRVATESLRKKDQQRDWESRLQLK